MEVAKETAQGLILRAKEARLEGPPVDVIGLVHELGIGLRPSDDVVDARIVGDGEQITIEFNPNRPTGRLRYSIAHELGHSCFSDVLAQPRHRTSTGAVPEVGDDNWELELVCNIIAAELLLPDRAVEGLLSIDTDIDFIMESRRRWDVSTEALLRRIVSSTPRSMALLVGSRQVDSTKAAAKVDYVFCSDSVPSDDPLRQVAHGDEAGGLDLARSIVAVGQTAKGSFTVQGATYSAQIVGTPGFPGNKLPRIMALLEAEPSNFPIPGAEYVSADILDFERTGEPVIIAHVVSDSARSWSRRGVANRLSTALPNTAQTFRAWAIADASNLRLGNTHSVTRELDGETLVVISMVAQEGFGPRWESRLRYDALKVCLQRVADIALSMKATVHLPRIGSGQAGGRWDYVERLISSELATRGIRVVVHTLPSIERSV